MLNRLNWIITSYLSCPLTWGVLAASVLFTGIAVLAGPGGNQQRSIAPRPQVFSHSIVNAAGLQDVRRRHEQAQIEQIDLGMLALTQQHDTGEDPTAPGARDLSELLEEFPNLRSVDVGQLLTIQPTSRIRERLARLPHLEYLSLQESPISKQTDLSWLRNLPRLHGLELAYLDDRQPDLSVLASLPQLQSLNLTNVPQPSELLLAEVAAIPHLRTLVIVPQSPDGNYAAAKPANYAALRGAPELRTFYFGHWMFGQQQNPASALQAVLPGLPVYPALVSSGRGQQFGIGMTIALLSAALAYQLAAQFHGSPSRVLPGFAPAQAIVAAGCWAAIVAVSTWLLGHLGLSLSMSFAVAATITTVLMAAEIVLLASHFRTQPVGSVQSLAITLCCAPMPGLLLTAPWWLEIHRGATLAASALLSAGCAGCLAGRLRAGREADPEVARSQGWLPVLPKSGWRSWIIQWHWSHAEWRIERLPPGTIDRSGWQRIGRWRLGTMPRGLWFVWMLTLTVMTSIAVAVSMVADSDRAPQIASRFLVFALIWLFIPSIGLTLAAWLWRVRSLPVESLRPGSDHFRSDLAAALALDLAPAVLLLACGGALNMNLDGQNHLHSAGLPASFAIFLVLGATLAGAAALSLVARRGWLVICLLAAAFFVSLFSVVYLAVIQGSPTAPPSAAEFSGAVQSQLWVPILLAGLLACVAAWRWRTMELAELES